MNPLFQALQGGTQTPQGNPMQNMAMMANGPAGGILGRMQQIAGMFQNPAQLVSKYFPDAPAEIQSDPEQLISWLQQTGRVNPQMVQMARQMMGR